MGDWQTFLVGLWAITSLAIWPFASWDEFEQRDKPLYGLWVAVMAPTMPFLAVVLIVSLLPLFLADKVSRMWKADWS